MKPRPELHGQTALRGVAALVVMIAHANFFHLFPGHNTFWELYHVLFWHNEAVDLFFVLSGFILCYVYTERRFHWRDYFVARFARIYPVYLAAFLFSLLMLGEDFLRGRGTEHFTAYTLISNLLLIQNWPFILERSLDVPTWSISVEIFLYIAIFPVLLLADKYLGFWLKCVLIILPVAILVALICMTWGTNEDGMDTVWAPLNPLRGIFCFTSGFFTCSVGLGKGFPAVLSRKGEIIFLLVTLSALALRFPFERKVAILCFPLLAYLSAQEGSILTRALAGKWFAWLGHLSYSIYIWHWALLRLVIMALSRLHKLTHYRFWESRYLVILLSFLLVFAVSHVSHFYFERPANKWIRKKFSRADPLPVSMR